MPTPRGNTSKKKTTKKKGTEKLSLKQRAIRTLSRNQQFGLNRKQLTDLVDEDEECKSDAVAISRSIGRLINEGTIQESITLGQQGGMRINLPFRAIVFAQVTPSDFVKVIRSIIKSAQDWKGADKDGRHKDFLALAERERKRTKVSGLVLAEIQVVHACELGSICATLLYRDQHEAEAFINSQMTNLKEITKTHTAYIRWGLTRAEVFSVDEIPTNIY